MLQESTLSYDSELAVCIKHACYESVISARRYRHNLLDLARSRRRWQIIGRVASAHAFEAPGMLFGHQMRRTCLSVLPIDDIRPARVDCKAARVLILAWTNPSGGDAADV